MTTYEPERTDEAWHLLRKIFLLFLVVIATSLGLVLLSRQRGSVPLVLFNILADASLGLLVGVATRFVLRGRNPLLQGLASAATSLVGLAVLGYLTGWRSGIGPFQVGLVPVDWLDRAHIALQLPVEFSHSRMDLLDLAQVILALDTSWIALRVWKQRTRVVGQRLPVRRVRRPAQNAAVPVVPARQIPSRSNTMPRPKRRKTSRSLIAKPAPAIRPMRAKSRRSRSLRRHQPAVHLAVYEEHRCPYCLEPVARNDPRGTVECQVCHTLHHKDCWDITGSCQVPHLNT